MTAFATHNGYPMFAEEVRLRRRHILTAAQQAFLEALLATASSRVETLPLGAGFYRAQVGCDWAPYEQDGVYVDDLPCPYQAPRMSPQADRAKEGRANPKGIPYLYGASQKETAIAEVRPWVSAYVSVGTFTLCRDLRIINCISDNLRFSIYYKEPDPPERERAVWRDVDLAFARPVTAADDVASYAPTQIIAELFRAHDIDGLAYRSSLGAGHNLTIFNPADAALRQCQVHLVKRVRIEVEPEVSPYATYTRAAP